MSDEPVFLSVAQATALHRFALIRHGGQDGLRDAAVFECTVLTHICA